MKISMVLGSAVIVAFVCMFWLIWKKELRIRSLQRNVEALTEEKEEWLQEANQKQNQDIEDERQRIELLSIVATQTENAIMIMDPEGNIEWINDGFTRLYGYDYYGFIKARGSNIRQTSFSGVIENRLHRCKVDQEPVVYDAPNITGDGQEIWTRTTLTPIFDEHGTVTHLAAIDTDIDQRKRAADVLIRELNVFRKSLDQLAEQHRALTDVTSRLFVNQEKAGQEVRGTHDIIRFIHHVSDQIKIMGLNASIEAASLHGSGTSKGAGQGFRVLSGEIIEMSEKTKVEAEKITGLINRLLESYDQVESGKKEVEETRQQYHKIIRDLEEGLQKVEEVADELNG